MNETNDLSFIQGEEDFFSYLDDEDMAKIKEALDKNKQIWKYKSKDNDDSTVLHISVYKKLYEISKLIIDYIKEKNREGLKDFINAQNNLGTTAIHFAAFKGDIKIIKLLIENGANIYTKTKRELNIFHYSSQGNKSTSLMYFYLKYYFLAKEKDQRIVDLIKSHDSGGSTPLHWAAYSSAEDILLYLINLKIFANEEERLNFINQRDNQGFTALHLSVSSKSVRIAMKLLQNGANSEIKDKKGETPLQLAINKNVNDIADIIRNNQSCELCNVKAPVKQIKKSIKNIVLIFIVQCLTTFILFIAVLSIAFNTSSYERNTFYDISFIIYLALLIIFFLLYIGLLIINPGLIEPKHEKDLKALINKGIDINKYCYECFIKKSIDIKHCIICHKCYEKFDHHCYWINKCVAKNNYSVFIGFLVETFFYLLIVLFISILALIHLIAGNDGETYVYNIFTEFTFKSNFLWDNKFYYYILNILLIVIDLFFLIPETLLLILHLHICCTNYREKKSRTGLLETRDNDKSINTALMKEDGNSYDSPT